MLKADVFSPQSRARAPDGFDFIKDLDSTDNIAYLTDRAPENVRRPYIIVGDVIRAVGDVAALHLESIPAKIVAVTGSVGKTTTKTLSPPRLTNV